MPDKTDLERLTGNDFREVAIKGRTIRIEPVKLKNLAAFAKASRNIADVFAAGSGSLEGIEFVTEIITAGSPLSAEEAGELNPAEALEVFSAVLSVNSSFFLSSVLPAFQGALKTLTGALGGRK